MQYDLEGIKNLIANALILACTDYIKAYKKYNVNKNASEINSKCYGIIFSIENFFYSDLFEFYISYLDLDNCDMNPSFILENLRNIAINSDLYRYKHILTLLKRGV